MFRFCENNFVKLIGNEASVDGSWGFLLLSRYPLHRCLMAYALVNSILSDATLSPLMLNNDIGRNLQDQQNSLNFAPTASSRRFYGYFVVGV